MALQILDANPEPQIPRKKKIVIAGLAEGTAEPHIHGSELSWHVALRPLKSSYALHLLQGHGGNPAKGIAAAIVTARQEIREQQEFLARLESELGTAGMSDEDVVRMVPSFNS